MDDARVWTSALLGALPHAAPKRDRLPGAEDDDEPAAKHRILWMPPEHLLHVPLRDIQVLLRMFGFDEHKWDLRQLSRNPGVTMHDVLVSHPSDQWHWDLLSANPTVTVEIVRQQRHREWDWDALTRNLAISVKEILANADLPWDGQELSSRPDLTPDDVLQNWQVVKWDVVSLVVNENIPPWSWPASPRFYKSPLTIAENPHTTLAYVMRTPELARHVHDEAFMKHLCYFGHITPADLRAHPTLPWNYAALTLNKGIPVRYMTENPQLGWSVEKIFDREDITLDAVDTFTQHLTDDARALWWLLSLNEGITVRHMLARPHYAWDWSTLSHNLSVTIADVLANPALPWKFGALSLNPGIAVHEMLAHPELPWDYDRMSQNATLRWQDVVDEPRLRNFLHLSENPFGRPARKSVALEHTVFLELLHERRRRRGLGAPAEIVETIRAHVASTRRPDGRT